MKRTVWLVGAAVLAAGIAVGVAIPLMTLEKRDDFWFEVAKTSVQFIFVAVLGGLVGLGLKRAEVEREDLRQAEQYVFRDVVIAYNGIKAARRILRAEGFRITSKIAAEAERFTDDQVKEYQTQMRSLSECQLTLEKVSREVGLRRLFYRQAKDLQREIDTVERYIGRVISEWERNHACVRPGRPLYSAASLPELQAFLAKHRRDDDDGFVSLAARPLRRIENALRGALPGPKAEQAPEPSAPEDEDEAEDTY